MSEALLTATELAEYLKIHVRTVRRWVREGRLPAIRMGRGLRFASDDVDEAVRRGRSASGPGRDVRDVKDLKGKMQRAECKMPEGDVS